MSSKMMKTRGMYFEEFEVGHQVITSGRTVTEADIVGFAGLTGDYNQIHTDAEFSKTTPFGERVAHGLLGLSIASGLIVLVGILEGTIMAFREINSWKFSRPIHIGDTIHVEIEIKETKLMKRLGGGLVVLQLDVKNQHGDTTMKGTWSALILSKPESE